MHKNFTRFFALSAVAALTIFAGKTFAESRKQALFSEIPVIKQIVLNDERSEALTRASSRNDAPLISAAQPAVSAAPKAVQVAQSIAQDQGQSPIDAAVTQSIKQRFSITGGAGDDEDEDEEDNEDDE